MNRLGVGVIGCGTIAQTYHLPALARCQNARLVAVMDTSAASAERAAALFNVPRRYTSLEGLLGDREVQAVLILSPNFLRVEQVEACASAGKAMLVQKPMSRNESEGERIIEAARRAGVLLVPSFMHRYLPEVLKAREYLQQGVLGSIRMVRVRNATPGSNWAAWFYNKELLGGGAVLDIGVHGIDLVRWLVAEIRSVSAHTERMTPARMIQGERIIPDNEDTAVALYRLENGALCVHEITWAEAKGHGRFAMELYGEEGSMLIRVGGTPLSIASRQLSPTTEWMVPDLPRPYFGVFHHEDFASAVVNGPGELTARPADGLIPVKVAHKIYEAAAQGRTLEV